MITVADLIKTLPPGITSHKATRHAFHKQSSVYVDVRKRWVDFTAKGAIAIEHIEDILGVARIHEKPTGYPIWRLYF